MEMAEGHQHHLEQPNPTSRDWFLFSAVIIFILVTSLVIQFFQSSFELTSWMRAFMGTFFVVFGLFKLADIGGFAMSYVGYDILARVFHPYAYLYPFLELGLGAGYFLNIPYINVATVILMTVGSIGVLRELLRGSKIHCACLGTYIKLPLTTVSLIEDVAMGLMALVLLYLKI